MKPLSIESFEKLNMPHHGSIFQKRGISSLLPDGLSPSRHILASGKLTFPLAEPAKLPRDVTAAANFMASKSPHFLREHWKTTLKTVEKRASELNSDRTQEILNLCHPELSKLTAKIHIPLLRELMNEYDMGGEEWIDQFYSGFPLIGTQGEAGVYPQQHDGSEEMLTREEVLITSKERFYQRFSSASSPFDAPLWKEALQQREKGWLIGPYPIVDGLAIIDGTPRALNFSFRFGVEQGEKLRAVDDLRQSLTNQATFINTPINLPTWDHFTSLTNLLRDLMPNASLAMGKTDHEDAYKNVPLAPNDQDLAAVTLKCHSDGKPYCFLTRTQLFGSISAVLQYNCLSRIIASLAVRLLNIPVMGYYDDFGIITQHELIKDALFSFTELNRILGFKMKPKKTLSGQILEFLGVVADFTPTPRNPPTLKLSDDRKEKISLYIREMLKEKRTSRAKLQKLLGKLNFAYTAVLGKYAGATLRPLYALSSAGTEAAILTINKDSLMSLCWWLRALWTLAPRIMTRPKRSIDRIIYSDAEGSGGCAALIFNMSLQDPLLLKRKLAPSMVDEISASTSAIYILEMYAMVGAVLSIHSTVPTNLILFIDNDAAAQALIKGSASVEQALLLIKLFWNHIASNHLSVWIERVASASNPADAPSRGHITTPKPCEIKPLPSLPLLLSKAKFVLSQKE